MRIICISGWLVVPINPDKCGSTVHSFIYNRINSGFKPFRSRSTKAFDRPCPLGWYPSHGNPVILIKFQITCRPRPLISAESKRKGPRQVFLSVAKASHWHKTWAEVPYCIRDCQTASVCRDVFSGCYDR